MTRSLLALAITVCTALSQTSNRRVLLLYSTNVERDHVEFARDAIPFFTALGKANHIEIESSSDWDKLATLSAGEYAAVAWLNDFPHTDPQRKAFEAYMEHGGGWIGFHIAAYNDSGTHWPWFVNFLGGAVFYTNNWPPLPATLTVDDPKDPIANGIPAKFTAPINEWYIWKPSPRLNPKVKVLLTLDPSNYPLGFKDVIVDGDLPVVWSNTLYNMVYLNMGHGDKILSDERQNQLLRNAFLSVVRGSAK